MIPGIEGLSGWVTGTGISKGPGNCITTTSALSTTFSHQPGAAACNKDSCSVTSQPRGLEHTLNISKMT